MKVKCIAVICLVVLFVLGCAAYAQEITGGPSIDIKYVQDPDTCDGSDFASMYDPIAETGIFIMFDDWVCPDGMPITDIHWWGSYWQTPGIPVCYSDTLQNAAPGGVNGFTIAIFGNITAEDSPLGFAMPDFDNEPLYEEYFQGACNETYQFTLQKNSVITEDVFSYDVFLSTPFEQEEGVTYWLAIAADKDPTFTEWGWHEADGHWGAYAVQGTFPGDDDPTIYIPCGGHDMAFALTTVPEPGSLMLLGLGIGGIFGMISKKRRSG